MASQVAALEIQGGLELTDLGNVVDALKRLVREANREAIRRGAVPVELADHVSYTFDTLVHMFDDVVRVIGPDAGAVIGARLQRELLPFLALAENAERWYAKPSGYAGDYQTIDRIYDDVPRGFGRVGPLLDRCFLDVPAARAVRNRRRLMQRELVATVGPNFHRPTRITTLAAGPARELFDTFAALSEPHRIAATLIDFDPQALAHCAARAADLGIKPAIDTSGSATRSGVSIDLVEANAIHLAHGRRTLALADQDLVYSIGLFDYFSDALAVKMLDYIHSILRPGGRVIVGNFHPCNPTKALMDHVLEWKLIHRDEDAMHALMRASAFGSRCSRIVYEGQGINLFAECVKV